MLLAQPRRRRARRGPIDLQNLAHEDWIVGSRQTDDRVLAERACAVAGFTPRIAHTVDDYDLLLRMVAAGLGVGFVPELALRFPGAKTVDVRTHAGAPITRGISILTRRALTASTLVRVLMAELAKTTRCAASAAAWTS